jgi:hypothetical protein
MVSKVARASLQALVSDLVETEAANIPRSGLFGVSDPELEVIKSRILDTGRWLDERGKQKRVSQTKKRKEHREKKFFGWSFENFISRQQKPMEWV